MLLNPKAGILSGIAVNFCKSYESFIFSALALNPELLRQIKETCRDGGHKKWASVIG